MGAACSSSPHPVEPSISGSTTSSKTPGSNPDPMTTRTDPQIPMTPPSSSSSSSTKTTNTNIHTIDQPALTIFSGTFNINAAQLNQSDAKLWLTDNKAQIATIVCLAFQECGSAPNEITPVPKNAIESPRPPESPSHVYTPKEYCRQNLKPAEAEANNEFLAVLKGALPSHKLVADLALGESPTGGKIEINGKETEWYGYVRLVVFYKGAEQLECQSVISPVGGKDSSFGQVSLVFASPPFTSLHLTPHPHPSSSPLTSTEKSIQREQLPRQGGSWPVYHKFQPHFDELALVRHEQVQHTRKQI